jgi:putative protease
MSILNKLSDVLKEVFWIKTSKRTTSSRRSKSKPKKIVRKTKPTKAKQKPKPVVTKPIKQKNPLKKTGVSKAVKSSKAPVVAKVKKEALDPKLVRVGEITHFFERINVCVVKITQGTILIGDKLTVMGSKTKLVQKVWSMQVESQDVKVAKKGQLIGLKVDKPVVVGDVVYK